MKKFKLLAIITIAVFILSVNGHVSTVAADPALNQDDDTLETNFELLLMTNAGNRIRESYAFFVKQALAPLGIDVEILAKPFGQFVGDLLHLSTGQPFDLAIIGFAGGGPTPGFMWKFHSTRTSFGQLMYQLNNPQWQDFMEQDIGISTAFVDDLLESIDFELDLLERRDKVNEFAELFMDQLLYDIPLTTVTARTAMWRGFGDIGDNSTTNDLWDDRDGAYASRALGAVWNDTTTPDARNDSLSETLQFRRATPGNPGNFDPYQSFDTSTTAQTAPFLTSSLLSFDGGFAPHPDIAYQWIVDTVTYDDDFNATSPDSTVEAGRHTFIIDKDKWQWPATQDYQNNSVAAHPVDANDIALALAMFKHPQTQLNGKELYEPVVKWEVDTTVTTNDTIHIYLESGQTTPDDYVTLGGLNPIPEHLLGGDLIVTNSTADTPFNETIQLGAGSGVDAKHYWENETYNPQNSYQWNKWETEEGNTLVGPMEIEEFNIDEGFWTFTSRDDYPFVNEWDMEEAYEDHTSEFETLNATINMTEGNWFGNISTFAPHTGVYNPPAYYWAFNGTDDNRQRPTDQGINVVVNKIIEDTNAALIAFENGDLDLFGSSALGANTVTEHQDNPNYVVRETVPLSGPTLLVFNLLNEHLQKRDVRKAIAHALDQEEMTKINDGFATSHGSPVWLVYDTYTPLEFKLDNGTTLSWYKSFENEYDYDLAYTLMTDNGYDARESPDANPEPVNPPVEDVFRTIGGILGADLWIGLSVFALAATVFVRRLRKFE